MFGSGKCPVTRCLIPRQASDGLHGSKLLTFITSVWPSLWPDICSPPPPDTCPLARLFRVMALTFMVTAYGVRVKAGSQHTNWTAKNRPIYTKRSSVTRFDVSVRTGCTETRTVGAQAVCATRTVPFYKARVQNSSFAQFSSVQFMSHEF